MIPIAVALFYCKLSTSITSQFSWITSQTFKFKYENLSIFLYRLILFLFSLFRSTMVNSMIIASYQISSWHYLDTYHIYLNQSCLAHTYSNYNCVIWVKCVMSQSQVLLLLLWCWFNSTIIAHDHVPSYPTTPLWAILLNITQSCPILAYLILYTCIELFNLQMS
jgi:hypothetical protein